MKSARRTAGIGLLLAALAPGCARQHVMLELHAAVLYEKPEIAGISYEVTDARKEGGTVTVEIRLEGDSGLEATFDISPGIADRERMSETASGRYVGRFAFPQGTVGGPFTVTGRLRHEEAGEVTLKDETSLTIPLYR